MSIAGLSTAEGQAETYIKKYCSHNYPQSASTANLATLMSHSGIASQIKPFAADVKAARAKGKPHVFGETNSGTTSAFLFCLAPCSDNRGQPHKEAAV